jgi:hypothetical protein
MMVPSVTRFIFLKLLPALLLPVLLSVSAHALSEDFTYIETATVRRYFFTHEKNWKQFVNSNRGYKIAGDDVQLVCDFLNDSYHMVFYPTRRQKNRYFSFGTTIYQFDRDRNLEKAIIFYQASDTILPASITEERWKKDIIPRINSQYTRNTLNQYYRQQNGRGPYLLNQTKLSRTPLFALTLWSVLNQLGLEQYTNESFLSFENNDENLMDIFLLGRPYKRNIPAYFPAERTKTATLSAIFTILEKIDLDDTLLLKRNDIAMKQRFIDAIVKPAINKEFIEDGARNEFGEFITIADNRLQEESSGFNCSGFVKEIADIYIRQFNPDFKWLSIEELKRRRDDNRDENSYRQYDLQYDPLFGLDWGRNIADNINELCRYESIQAELLQPDGMYASFQSSGFLVKDLEQILFKENQEDPAWIYMVIFNRIRSTKPVIPEFYHLSILVPQSANEEFTIRVFESNAETSFEQLSRIHAGEKAAIIKIPVPYFYY